MSNDHQILGEYADQGFSLEEDADATLLLYYKDKMVAEFSQLGATQHSIRESCKRFIECLKEPAGIPK